MTEQRIDEAEALYHTMSVQDLVLLRHAFCLDRDNGPASVDRPFCQGRIDAITRELKARGVKDDAR